MSKGKELYDLSLKLLVVSSGAFLVTEGLKDKEGNQISCWLPKSQVECETDEDDMQVGRVYTFTIPAWLVESKGLTV